MVNNYKIRQIMSQGSKYRLHKQFDIKEMANNLTDGLNNYINDTCSRLRKDPSLFCHWRNRIMARWLSKITQVNIKDKHSEEITSADKRYLNKLKSHFVITTVDKAAQTFCITCKRFYLDQIYRELDFDKITHISSSNVYKLITNGITNTENTLINKCKGLGYSIDTNNHKLPFIYIIPKFHKNPVKFRTIIASKHCITKQISYNVALCLNTLNKSIKNYCNSTYNITRINSNWIIDNNKPILDKLNEINKKDTAKSIETYDFTTLYTTLDHTTLLNSLDTLINKHINTNYAYKICGKRAYWNKYDQSKPDYSLINNTTLSSLIHFVVENTYFTFGQLVFKQNIGIPMGTDCAPHLANLMLYELESNYMSKLSKTNIKDCRILSNTYRYIDDITNINGKGLFDKAITSIYPDSLSLVKVNQDIRSAEVLDIKITIANNEFVTELYDKKRNFSFYSVNFPHPYSNISTKMCYQVYAGQITRYQKINSKESTFIHNVNLLNIELIKKGYKRHRLQATCHNTLIKYKIMDFYKTTIQILYSKIKF